MGRRSPCRTRVLFPLTIALAVGCLVLSAASSASGQDVSHLVPARLSFATSFIQYLSDGGWKVRDVRDSIYNGGIIPETKRAAWIKTDQGILEALFFEKQADLEKIRIVEEPGSNASYHKYTVTTATSTQGMEGRLPVYFTKYRNALIVTYDRKLTERLMRLLR